MHASPLRVAPWLLTAAFCLAAPLRAQEPGPTWAAMADLSEARGRHSATLLANGTVLIAGGQDVAGRPLAASEIYDPATGIYSPLASPLPMPLWGHTAARLDDGTVLIAGGNGEGGLPVADAQLFDPAAAAFIRVGYMSTPRSQHTGMLLGDGRVLLAGGTDGATAVARLELYDPAARTISPAPSALLAPRQNHIATRLIDGRVLIAGGSNSSGMVGTAELYDPSSGTVATARVLNVARELASGATLLDGTVLVAGGRSAENLDLDMAEVYSPVANTFTLVPALMSTARSGHLGVQLLHNGKVLIAGGTNAGQLVANAEVYDPVTGAFRTVESPTTARQLFAANFFYRTPASCSPPADSTALRPRSPPPSLPPQRGSSQAAPRSTVFSSAVCKSGRGSSPRGPAQPGEIFKPCCSAPQCSVSRRTSMSRARRAAVPGTQMGA